MKSKKSTVKIVILALIILTIVIVGYFLIKKFIVYGDFSLPKSEWPVQSSEPISKKNTVSDIIGDYLLTIIIFTTSIIITLIVYYFGNKLLKKK